VLSKAVVGEMEVKTNTITVSGERNKIRKKLEVVGK
jgi:hypothetical protein